MGAVLFLIYISGIIISNNVIFQTYVCDVKIVCTMEIIVDHL